jgi:hypothetical protein
MFQTIVADVAVSGTVDIANPVDIGGGSLDSLGSIADVVNTQSDALVLYSHTIPAAGGTLPNVTGIPAWVRAVYVIVYGSGSDCQITITGNTSGIDYMANYHMGSQGLYPMVVCLPVVGLLDPALQIFVQNNGGVAMTMTVIAIPELSIAPVQNLLDPGARFKVDNIAEAPELFFAATQSLSSTATTVIAGVPNNFLSLWTIYIDNAASSTATVVLQDTSGQRIWAGVLPNAANIVLPLAGLPLVTGRGVQMTATVAGNYHVTIVYAQTQLGT